MGDLRIDDLPRSLRWQKLIALIVDGAGAAEIAAATLDQSEKEIFLQADADDGVLLSTWLLSQIPQAARSQDFVGALRQLGLRVPDDPSLANVLRAFTERVDEELLRTGERSDIGEMAELSAVASLSALVAQHTDSLFGLTTHALQEGLRRFSTERGFGLLAREFFSRLLSRYLGYFLSRELPNHIGGIRRFSGIEAHAEFKAELDHHARDATSRVEELAGRWLSSATFKLGRLEPQQVRWFIHEALEKVSDDLRRGMG